MTKLMTDMLIAFMLGQIAYAAISIYILQKNLSEINYWQAAIQYFKKEVGGLIVAASGWAIVMFIASDWIDVSISRKDLLLKETLTIKEKLIVFQRTFAVGLGAFIQHLVYLAYKKGKKAIHDYEKQNNIEDGNNNKP